MYTKGRYVSVQILLACRSNGKEVKHDIHALLAQTIKERKRILVEWQKSFWKEKSIHELLQETIAERKKLVREWEKQFQPAFEGEYSMQDTQAA